MSVTVYIANRLQTKLNTDRRYNDQTRRKKKHSNRFC